MIHDNIIMSPFLKNKHFNFKNTKKYDFFKNGDLVTFINYKKLKIPVENIYMVQGIGREENVEYSHNAQYKLVKISASKYTYFENIFIKMLCSFNKWTGIDININLFVKKDKEIIKGVSITSLKKIGEMDKFYF